MVSSPFSPLSFKALVRNNVRKHKKCSSRKASSGHATTMDDLPPEVLSEIFTRILAKQLAQMRKVSKSWNALLSDSTFIKAHLTRSVQKNDEVLLFSGLIISFKSGPSPFRPRLSRSPDVELTDFIKLPAIRQGNFNRGIVIGSVNGLICFYYGSSDDEFILHIWNPSLSALLSLPPISLRPCCLTPIELGFGYDPISDDYKIVNLTPNMEQQPGEVYSMRKGSWNLISQTFPSRLKIRGFNKQVYANGHVHWLCDSELEGNPQMIVAFNLDVETFSQIPLPDAVCKWSNHFGVMGGKLCVMSKDRDGGGEWEVWVMNEYGVAESWVKHPIISEFSADIFPYGFTSRGEFLLQLHPEDDPFVLADLHFGLYDPVAAKTKTFKMKLESSLSKVVEYVDSLVWVAPPT